MSNIALSYIPGDPVDDLEIAHTKTKLKLDLKISNKVLTMNFFLIYQPRCSVALAQYCGA